MIVGGTKGRMADGRGPRTGRRAVAPANRRQRSRPIKGTGGSLPYDHGPLNPRLGLNLYEMFREDLDRFRDWLHGEIVKPGWPDGRQTVGIFDIEGRRALRQVFRRPPGTPPGSRLAPEFFQAVRLVAGLEVGCDFDDRAERLRVVCRPAHRVLWEEIKDRVRAKAAEIPLEERYRLSESASGGEWPAGRQSSPERKGLR